MKIRYADDDGGLIDPMDAYKEREIERLENERRQVEPWAAMMATLVKSIRQPAFAPHCPECYSGNVEPKQSLYGQDLRACNNCGLWGSQIVFIDLRPLLPCPAPPYTQAEVDQLCAPSC